jgi:hypothetical protein
VAPAGSGGGRKRTRGAKAGAGDEALFSGEEGVGGAGAPARPRGKVIPSDRYRLLAREAAAIIEARRRGESEPTPEEPPDDLTPLLTEEPEQ